MKTKNLFKLLVLVLAFLFVEAMILSFVMAQDEKNLGEALHQMRVKQQEEEQSVVRIIAQPHTIKRVISCSEVQLTRQRLRDIGQESEKQEQKFNGIKVELGHDNTRIRDNHGTINNNINMEVVQQNEADDRCL